MVNGITLGYARVLFDLGIKNQNLEIYAKNSSNLLDILNSDPELSKILINTSISKEERKVFVQDIFAEFLDINFIRFIWTIIDFDRARLFETIIKTFLKLCNQYYDIGYVKVTSAFALSDKEKQALEAAIKIRFNKDKVVLSSEIDPSIIGGIKIESDSIAIDDTIKNRIQLIKKDLLGNNKLMEE
ncbi:MAG: ATP synthase F1 subunit delta [Mycoplasmataceae bacterium]|jgi:F-type H+-transporting ATPase subunit delta|nr:ATP synthase F1 subunit delta [Mycoplasmataceae bacterium]